MRLRKRAAAHGLDSFEPHEILELLLFQSIRRSNTNETAHRLLDVAGSLRALLREVPEKLTRVRGVGKASARLISSVIPSFSREMTDALRNGKPFSRWSLLAAADFRLNIAGETAGVLLLSENGALLDWNAARDAESLFSLVSAARQRIRTSGNLPGCTPGSGEEPSPAAYAVVLREDAADVLSGTDGDSPVSGSDGKPDRTRLRPLFPDAAGVAVICSDRRMEEW